MGVIVVASWLGTPPDRKRWNTRIELANAIFDYLEIWHNRQRRHSQLGMC